MASNATYAAPLDRHLQAREREFLAEARERWDSVATSRQETRYRADAEQALLFAWGEQWDPRVRQQREALGRPCLTINTTGQYERQILNELRRQPPEIKVRPVGNGADVDTAKALQGVVRHIEQQSHATQAYYMAAEDGLRHGRGFFRLRLDYEGPESFQQTIRIAPIANAFSVYYGPASLPTYADADWCFVFQQMRKEAFQAQYDVTTSEMSHWTGQGDTWLSSDEVRVAEYFAKEREWMTLGMLDDGQTVLLEPLLYEGGDALTDPGAFEETVCQLLRPKHGERPIPWLRKQAAQLDTLMHEYPADFRAWWVPQATELLHSLLMARPTAIETVYHSKINGHVILESAVWPGKYLPIIPVLGNVLRINNEMRLSGYLKDAMDPMRAKNYWVTMQAEHVSLSPVPPWLVTEDQIDAYQREWESANRIPRAYLKYRRYDDQGRDLGTPQRNSFEPPIQALTLLMQGAERDVETTLGIYRATLGAPSQQQSGVALEKREEQVDTGTFHYADNLRIAMEYCGEQLVELFPKILPQETAIRMLGEDGNVSMAMFRQGGKAQDEQLPKGIQGIYDISTGTYDVNISTGPSYENKRDEALERLIQLSDKNPKVAELGADLIVANIDAPGMEELGRRLKKTLPPDMLEEAPQNDPDAQLAALQSQNTQLTQQLEALNAFQQQQQQAFEQMQQENETMKAGLALKEQELVLHGREIDIDKAKAEAEIAQGYEKLQIEREKLALERQKVAAMDEEPEAPQET